MSDFDWGFVVTLALSILLGASIAVVGCVAFVFGKMWWEERKR